MKKVLILCTVVALISSCTGYNNDNDETVTSVVDPYNTYKHSKHVYILAPFGIVTIDSCEYIVYGAGSNSGLLTHKGNCKNHKR